MTVPGRECGSCHACCVDADIPALEKKAGEQCKHLTDSGCAIYDSRPEMCRAFDCGWRMKPSFRADERPDVLGIMVMGFDQGGLRMNVAHEIRAGALDSWKGDRMVKRESKRDLLGIARYGKRKAAEVRIAGPRRMVEWVDRRVAKCR